MSKTSSRHNEYYYKNKVKDLTDEIHFYRSMIAKLRQDKIDLEQQLDMMEELGPIQDSHYGEIYDGY
jgi:hypothetical protein